MSTAAVRRDWVGSLAGGKFPLLQWIGGSQGAGVFLTERNEHAGKAIIKLIPADIEDAHARLSAWEAAATLSHPNLIEIYAHGRCEIDGVQCLYVVTEFADEVLAEILKERPLTPEETRELLGPALDALAYLHGKGLVHSRLKPSNIMASGDRLKLSTDGLSFAGSTTRPSATRTVYDAPEVADGTIGPPADLWSLGATLVEVLTQHPPQWDGLATSEPMVPQSVPQPFAVIARRCLRTDMARRGTIEAMQSRLNPATLEPTKVPLDQEEKAAGKMSPSRRRVAVLFAIATVLLAAIVIWKSLSHRKQPSAPAPQAQNVPPAIPAQAPAPASASQTNPGQTSVEPPAPSLPTASGATSTPPQAPATVPAPVPAAAPAPQPQPQVDQTSASTGTTINPAIVNQILPDIVPSAMKTINGTLRVSIELAVGPDGNVTGATLESAGPSKYFAGKSLEAARHWKFKPAQVDGHAASSNWTLEFQYKQSGIHVVAEQTAP
ncbi:MAG: TonB family protein [Terracidiphilus sp.]